MRLSIAATGFACTAAAAALVVSAGTASAADGNTKTTIYTLANPGICAGIIDAGVGHYPSSAVLGLTVGTSKDVVGPGIGIWDVTVTSNGASFGAQPMTIDVPQYQG